MREIKNGIRAEHESEQLFYAVEASLGASRADRSLQRNVLDLILCKIPKLSQRPRSLETRSLHFNARTGGGTWIPAVGHPQN